MFPSRVYHVLQPLSTLSSRPFAPIRAARNLSSVARPHGAILNYGGGTVGSPMHLRQLSQRLIQARFSSKKASHSSNAGARLRQAQTAARKDTGHHLPNNAKLVYLYVVDKRVYRSHVFSVAIFGALCCYIFFLSIRYIRISMAMRSEREEEKAAKIVELDGIDEFAGQEGQEVTLTLSEAVRKWGESPAYFWSLSVAQLALVLWYIYHIGKRDSHRALTIVARLADNTVQVQHYPSVLNYISRSLGETWRQPYSPKVLSMERHPKNPQWLLLDMPSKEDSKRMKLLLKKDFIVNREKWQELGLDLDSPPGLPPPPSQTQEAPPSTSDEKA